MNKPKNRKNEVASQFLALLDQHIEDIISGKETEFLSIKSIAQQLAISQTHFSFLIKEALGQKPCHYYDEKIINKAKVLLADPAMLPADVARKLTYDPSNFSKFFKKWTGETPGEYRHRQLPM